MPANSSAPPPALARAVFDRAADERTDPALIRRLRERSDTRVLVVAGDRIRTDGDQLHLDVPARLAGVEIEHWAFLGRTQAGAPLLLAAVSDAHESGDSRWASLRTAGAVLPAEEATALVTAVALARWLRESPYCPACGALTDVIQSGWARRCPSCGREHFPRTDPAVIVAVTSADDRRVLLGRNAQWGDRAMYSTFAGFVEAGESIEATVAREVEEEAGVRLHGIRYRSSQPWPYPRSLMLGFHATAVDETAARPDGEEIVDVRWFDRQELRAGFSGRADFSLPGPASIAHMLIREWLDADGGSGE